MSLSAKSIDIKAEPVDEITPYRVITMLLDGALERVDQAIISLDEGDLDEANVLVAKTIGIVGGLRESLDTNKGGELANNLDLLSNKDKSAKLRLSCHDRLLKNRELLLNNHLTTIVNNKTSAWPQELQSCVPELLKLTTEAWREKEII